MSGAQSISARRAYGVQRVCRVWGRAGPASPCDGTRRGRAPHGAAGRSVPPRTRCWSATSRPSTRSLTVSWRRVPESVGEAAGRKDPHLAGTGATVDAGARPPGPVPRGSCALSGPKAHGGTITTAAPDVMWGTDMTSTTEHGDGRRGGDLRLRGRRSLYDRVHRSPCGQAGHPV